MSMFDRIINGSGGMQAARMMEALGIPSSVAEMAGAQMDAGRGDLEGVQRLMMAASQGLSVGQADNLFGRGLSPQGFVPRPSTFLGGAVGLALGGPLGMGIGAALGGALGNLANPLLGRGFNPFGGVSREAPFGMGLQGRSIEAACRRDPFFKQALERQLGGTILPDGANDGRMTIYRPPFSQLGGVMRQALGQGLMPQTGLAATLAGLSLPMGGMLGGNMVAGSIMRTMQRMEGNMTAFMGQMQGDNVTQARGDLMTDPNTRSMAQGMGIDIRNASFEDILFLMLMKYAKKKEDDVMAKVKQLDTSSKAAEDKKAAGGAGGTGGAETPNTAGGTGGAADLSSGELGGQMDPEKMSETMKQQMMQKLMGDLNKLYEMLSNMIKSMHDMQMTPVRNLRG